MSCVLCQPKLLIFYPWCGLREAEIFVERADGPPAGVRDRAPSAAPGSGGPSVLLSITLHNVHNGITVMGYWSGTLYKSIRYARDVRRVCVI
jgi:hypothetical protein